MAGFSPKLREKIIDHKLVRFSRQTNTEREACLPEISRNQKYMGNVQILFVPNRFEYRVFTLSI